MGGHIIKRMLAAAVAFLPGGSLVSITVQDALIELDVRAASAGDVKYIAGESAPTGWLKANGALVSRAAYAALFAQIGTTYGAGDGATTFALPDLRGEFLRGWDDSRGIDAGRVRASAQADELRSHTHDLRTSDTGGGNRFPAGSSSNLANANGIVQATGGAETRPRNIALLAVIKY